ncbi:hypothetical protein [Actinoplanes solisilvae]|uniref:hypothetical protein n=1 Tax=Actinoplanes solisilvae TaxID=2486853 RepID=UPI000FDBAA19|nr:hypothetical protein [Actinoplanes solisilvae]
MVTEPLDAMQRARWELSAMAGRLRSLEAKLVDERRRSDELRKERDRERRRANRLRAVRAVLRRLRPAHHPVIPVQTAPSGRPVHLYVVIGLEFEMVREFVLTLRQRLLVDPDHRPVVMTDCSNVAELRDPDVLLEYLPDRATWERHRPDRSWEDVLSERLSRLYRDHGSVRTVFVDRAHPPTLAELLR